MMKANESNTLRLIKTKLNGKIICVPQAIPGYLQKKTKKNHPTKRKVTFKIKDSTLPPPAPQKLKLFNCKKCDKKFCDGERHFSSSMFACPTCNRCGIKLQNLYNFCLRIDGFDQKFLCIRCSEDVERKFLYDHEEDANSDLLQAKSKQETQCLQIEKIQNIVNTGGYCTDSSSGDDLYGCSKCDANFSTAIELDNHTSTKHKFKNRVKCRICPDTFKVASLRNNHEIDAHKNTDTDNFVCIHCNREMKKIQCMETHVLQQHEGTYHMTCEVCGKGFNRKSLLKNHMENHNESKDYECHLCYKKFRLKYGLTRHILRHSDERPFSCNQCDKTYRDMSDLRRHRYSHGGYEKKFSCLICEKKFYENKTLRYHLRTHEKHSSTSDALPNDRLSAEDVMNYSNDMKKLYEPLYDDIQEN